MDQRKDNKMYYLLLDEIQEVEDFESVLNSFLGKGNLDVYVTGSNSKFLSNDIKTELPDYSPHFKEVGGSIFDLSVIKASLDNTRQIKECRHNQYLHYLYLLIFLHWQNPYSFQSFLTPIPLSPTSILIFHQKN